MALTVSRLMTSPSEVLSSAWMLKRWASNVVFVILMPLLDHSTDSLGGYLHANTTSCFSTTDIVLLTGWIMTTSPEKTIFCIHMKYIIYIRRPIQDFIAY